MLVTEIRDRLVFEEIEPKNGNLLRNRETLSGFLGHGEISGWSLLYSSRRFVTFRLKRKQSEP